MIDAAAFRNLAGQFPSGVTIVTVHGPEGHPVGATVSAFASVSLDPPLVSVCLANTSRTAQALYVAQAFAVNVLREDQRELAELFAEPGNGTRFDGIDARTCDIAQLHGLPVICDSLATLVCRTHRSVPAGDHTIFIGHVVGGRAREGSPLLHCRGAFGCFRP